jgi:hypothetical protein
MAVIGHLHPFRPARLLLQYLVEIEIPGLVSRGVCVGDIPGQHLGSPRPQLQRPFMDTQDIIEFHFFPSVSESSLCQLGAEFVPLTEEIR